MLFISHSSKDQQVASALVDLIKSALAVSPEQIRCSSLPGYELESGVNIDDTLRREVHEAKAFIGLISYNSLQSMYVVFELGLRWGSGKHLIPLKAPGISLEDLGGPLAALNIISCERASHLHKLLRELAHVLMVRHNPADTYQRELDKVLSLPLAKKIIVPLYLSKQLELDYRNRKGNLTDSQKEILNYIEKECQWRGSVPQKDIQTHFRGKYDSAYWRLEALCFLGFLEKEITDRIEGKATFNYRLTPEYKDNV